MSDNKELLISHPDIKKRIAPKSPITNEKGGIQNMQSNTQNKTVKPSNASIGTMDVETYQNSPYTQGSYNMDRNQSQFNQQQQEQNYLNQLRQQQYKQQNYQNQQSFMGYGQVPFTPTINQPDSQQPMQTFPQQYKPMNQPQMGQNFGSLATMDPSTYQNAQRFQQQHNSPIGQQAMQQQYRPMFNNTNFINPNGTVGNMPPSISQNSPYAPQYFQQQQYRPMGQGYGSLATMDPSTYQNVQGFQQQHNAGMNKQPMEFYQQQYQPMQPTNNNPNASLETMSPDTYQNSPYTQGMNNTSNQYTQGNQQQQEQIYLQNLRQQLANQKPYNPKQPTQ